MKVAHRVSFPGAQQYEQYEARFEIETEDLDLKELVGLNLLERMFVFETLVAYEGILFQHIKGFIDRDLLNAQTKRLFGLLTPKLEMVVKSILANGGVKKEKKESGAGSKKQSK